MDEALRREAELVLKWERRGGLKEPDRWWLRTGKYIDDKGRSVDPDHPEAVPLWASEQR